MAGRPWGPTQAEDEVVRGVALWLRDLMKRSGRTVREVAAACKCAPSTVSARINGAAGPPLNFCDQVIEACVPRAEWPVRKKELRKLLARRSVLARELVVPDARTRVLDAQAETARAQAQTVRVLSELSLAKDQLLAGMRLEFQAQQIITALRAVLVHLVGSGTSSAEDQTEARSYLERAKDERDRAERLADDAQAVLVALGQRLSATGIPVADPVVTSDAMLLDVTAGLANVGQILDRQDRQLSRWEGGTTSAAAAARLSTLYADAPMPAAILDADDRILWANDRFEDYTGCSAAELGGMRWTQLVRGWSESADHLVYHHRYGHIESWQVQRWTASGCQVAVLHNPQYPDECDIPSVDGAGKKLSDSGAFLRGRFGAVQVQFGDRSSADLDDRLLRMMFELVCPGLMVLDCMDDRYLVIFDGERHSLARLLRDIEQLCLEFPGSVIEGAVEPGAAARNELDELRKQIETAERWAERIAPGKLWTVRTPVFAEICSTPEEPVRYRVALTRSGSVAAVQVVNEISLAVFEELATQLPRWAEASGRGGRAPDVEIDVTAADLNRHDWCLCLPKAWDMAHRIHLVLDSVRDFDSFALLRRFEPKGSVGVRPAAPGRDVPGNRLVPTRIPLAVGPSIDATAVESMLRGERVV